MAKLLLAALVTTAATVAIAQPATPADTLYSSSISYHVPEESRPAFEAWWKDRGRKLSAALMQEGPSITSLSITRVIYGGTHAPEANFYQTTFSTAVPKNHAATYERLSQKLFSKPYTDLLKEVMPLRKRLGQVLSRQWANAGRQPSAEGDIVRLDRKKISPGRLSDYLQVEQQHQPLRAAQVAAGKLKNWSAWAVVLPGGGDREFDAFTTHICKDLESSLTWNQSASALAAAVSPPVNYAALSARASDVARTTYGETRVVVALVRRP